VSLRAPSRDERLLRGNGARFGETVSNEIVRVQLEIVLKALRSRQR
jgi:hypothetical protein